MVGCAGRATACAASPGGRARWSRGRCASATRSTAGGEIDSVSWAEPPAAAGRGRGARRPAAGALARGWCATSASTRRCCSATASTSISACRCAQAGRTADGGRPARRPSPLARAGQRPRRVGRGPHPARREVGRDAAEAAGRTRRAGSGAPGGPRPGARRRGRSRCRSRSSSTRGCSSSSAQFERKTSSALLAADRAAARAQPPAAGRPSGATADRAELRQRRRPQSPRTVARLDPPAPAGSPPWRRPTGSVAIPAPARSRDSRSATANALESSSRRSTASWRASALLEHPQLGAQRRSHGPGARPGWPRAARAPGGGRTGRGSGRRRLDHGRPVSQATPNPKNAGTTTSRTPSRPATKSSTAVSTPLRGPPSRAAERGYGRPSGPQPGVAGIQVRSPSPAIGWRASAGICSASK